MIELLVPLQDIVLDIEDPVDLSSLPHDRAITLLRDFYSFMGASLEVEIERRLAHIGLARCPDGGDEALELYAGAVRLAE